MYFFSFQYCTHNFIKTRIFLQVQLNTPTRRRRDEHSWVTNNTHSSFLFLIQQSRIPFRVETSEIDGCENTLKKASCTFRVLDVRPDENNEKSVCSTEAALESTKPPQYFGEAGVFRSRTRFLSLPRPCNTLRRQIHKRANTT